ncbi:MAG: AAA family ATPase, partial [Pseudonocardia sp.]
MGGGPGGRVTRPLCPVLIGRDAELHHLTTALDEAARDQGAAVILRGEPGIGKTRLARETVDAAQVRGMRVLVGRNVQHGQAPYRPLTEALFATARAGALPDTPGLRPFRHALGTIVPDWRDENGAGDQSPVVIAEGVLRLARALGGDSGTLLVVEDLHWADADTLAVLEYLADNVTGLPLVLLATLRPDPSPASDLVTRLEVRSAASVIDLQRLGPTEVAAMAAACAEGAELPAEVVDAVGARSEGLPLLVEELIAVPASGVSQAVPSTFADAVVRRMEALPAEATLVVHCAAVLGRRFDWRLLPAVTSLSEDRVRDGLAEAVRVQLLITGVDRDFRFRHTLTRDAVLSALLPPARVALARRAAQAVERDGGPGSDDTRVMLAADLWCAAGEPDVAAGRLVAAGRRALDRGALVMAERLLERARTLATGDERIRTEAAEALTEALALAPKLDDALTAGAEALALLDAHRAPTDRRARLHLLLARAADAATRWPLAGEHLAQAAALAADERLRTAVDALAAHVAMGERRHDDAERLATRAVDAALRMDLPEVACEALEVLGRRERLRDLGRAEVIFARARTLADDRGLVLWSMRALHELGTIDMLRSSSPTRLELASDQAYRAGALSLAATVDLQLAGLHAYLFEIDAALEVGTRTAEVAGALGLTEVHVGALLQLGFAHAIAGRRTEMEDAVEAALRLAGEQPEPVAWAWGHVRATASLLAEDRARAREEMAVALRWAQRSAAVTTTFTALSA